MRSDVQQTSQASHQLMNRGGEPAHGTPLLLGILADFDDEQ